MTGTVIGRSRRYVGQPAKECVEYRVLAGTDMMVVTEWEPTQYEAVGTRVAFPVSIRPFVGKGGAAGYRLTRRGSLSGDF